MYSDEKIKQVFNAIKENGIEAFDDESLAKLLAILTSDELDVFIRMSYEEFTLEHAKRIMNIKPLVDVLVNRDLYRIRTSGLYQLFLESLKKSEYRNFFKSLRIEELADLKKYITYTVNNNDKINTSGSKKVINMITREIKNKEGIKKPRFESNSQQY